MSNYEQYKRDMAVKRQRDKTIAESNSEKNRLWLKEAEKASKRLKNAKLAEYNAKVDDLAGKLKVKQQKEYLKAYGVTTPRTLSKREENPFEDPRMSYPPTKNLTDSTPDPNAAFRRKKGRRPMVAYASDPNLSVIKGDVPWPEDQKDEPENDSLWNLPEWDTPGEDIEVRATPPEEVNMKGKVWNSETGAWEDPPA